MLKQECHIFKKKNKPGQAFQSNRSHAVSEGPKELPQLSMLGYEPRESRLPIEGEFNGMYSESGTHLEQFATNGRSIISPCV